MVSTDALFADDVLHAADGEVSLSEGFAAAVERYRAEFEGRDADELAVEIRGRVDDDAVVEPLAALGAEDPRTVAELCALSEWVETDGEWLRLLPPLRLFRQDDVRTDGAPESFVPVPATHLPQLTRVYSPALVYAWLDDDESCDLAKRDLESVFETPQGVMPFAVFGPNYREFLATEYDLTAGPALLFMRDGTVEARLYGAHGPGTVETELARHRE